MIYVRIELWPGGNRLRASVLAEAEIANISGLRPTSNYRYRLFGKNRSRMGSGQVFKFPCKRLMAWDLLYRILRDARHERNIDPNFLSNEPFTHDD